MPKKKKSRSAPLGPGGRIEVATAFLFSLAVCVAIALKATTSLGVTLADKIANFPRFVRQAIETRDLGPLIVLLFILGMAGGVAAIATSRARRRTGPITGGRAVVNGLVDAIVGLLFEALELATSGGGSSSSSSSSSGGTSGGGGSFGGGGASGGW